ncbi:hypothetical protein [Vibrio sp. SCSIO 43136]|uniref:hypothetical protein n=1 Tax=Vibrio sp. SCSIO 43136 TaxID=2819101 RepID=UPI002075C298|nr:hypothetical protein [Vibrio sp. SCSIO 43136]USD64107.1 hypothetical protein J4N39_08235 [Vibrio sp. SCSIO 43136]
MEEFIHEFSGFSGYPSKCHIRILDQENMPLVIMCTQVHDNEGTSVTNMAEDIAQEIKRYLERDNLTLSTAISRYLRERKLSEMLGDLVRGLKEANKYTVFALESIKLALEHTERYRSKKERVDGFIWVEHYPKGVLSIVNNDLYSVVTFSGETWSPNWNHCNIASISEFTGYSESYFRSPKEALPQT